jgi:hypothetical protein
LFWISHKNPIRIPLLPMNAAFPHHPSQLQQKQQVNLFLKFFYLRFKF